MDFRTLLAALLGAGLGLVFVAYPEAVVSAHTAGRRPPGRRGEYGEESVSDRWRRVVQVVGVGLLVAGLYFGVTLL